MSKTHLVAQGEFLPKIARAYGFTDFHTIWDAPENRGLKEKRKNPNILLPGDKLFIPDQELREESRATERTHRFELQGEKLMLRIELIDLKNRPIQGHEGTLIVEGRAQAFKTASNGIVETEISVDHGAGQLIDRGKPEAQAPVRSQLEVPLRIGHLDPSDTFSGQIARLNNLGYLAGEIPQKTLTAQEEEKLRKSPRFLSAVEEFQCDFGLTLDGLCGKITRDKLAKVHGC